MDGLMERQPEPGWRGSGWCSSLLHCRPRQVTKGTVSCLGAACAAGLLPPRSSCREGGNRQNRLHLESRTPSWARLWTLSYLPSIYGNDVPMGKPDVPEGTAPGLVPRLSIA